MTWNAWVRKKLPEGIDVRLFEHIMNDSGRVWKTTEMSERGSKGDDMGAAVMNDPTVNARYLKTLATFLKDEEGVPKEFASFDQWEVGR